MILSTYTQISEAAKSHAPSLNTTHPTINKKYTFGENALLDMKYSKLYIKGHDTVNLHTKKDLYKKKAYTKIHTYIACAFPSLYIITVNLVRVSTLFLRNKLLSFQEQKKSIHKNTYIHSLRVR